MVSLYTASNGYRVTGNWLLSIVENDRCLEFAPAGLTFAVTRSTVFVSPPAADGPAESWLDSKDINCRDFSLSPILGSRTFLPSSAVHAAGYRRADFVTIHLRSCARRTAIICVSIIVVVLLLLLLFLLLLGPRVLFHRRRRRRRDCATIEKGTGVMEAVKVSTVHLRA